MIIPYIVEKFGDPKFAEPLTRLVQFMCKGVPPKYLISHIIKYVRST